MVVGISVMWPDWDSTFFTFFSLTSHNMKNLGSYSIDRYLFKCTICCSGHENYMRFLLFLFNEDINNII